MNCHSYLVRRGWELTQSRSLVRFKLIGRDIGNARSRSDPTYDISHRLVPLGMSTNDGYIYLQLLS